MSHSRLLRLPHIPQYPPQVARAPPVTTPYVEQSAHQLERSAVQMRLIATAENTATSTLTVTMDAVLMVRLVAIQLLVATSVTLHVTKAACHLDQPAVQALAIANSDITV